MLDLDVGLCSAALLSDLSALDQEAGDPDTRRALIFSALESAEWLAEAGGGPLGADRIEAIRNALRAELGGAS
jgi:hypothetical protein